jgi:ribokinase
MKKSILVVGSLNMDLVAQAARHPQPGEALWGSAFHTTPGGKGANQAIAAARLGAKVELIGRVGTDAFGDALLAALDADGVAHPHLQRGPQPTGVSLVTLNPAGEATLVSVPGANAALSPADLEAAQDAFPQGGILLVQLELPLATVEAAVALACDRGMLAVLNPSPPQALPDSLLRQVDTLLPNEGELAALSGSKDLEEGVTRLLRRGVRSLAVSLGGRGLLLGRGEQRLRLPAQRVTAVDGLAAGDAFVGAFVAALAEGLPPEQACRWANAAGAIAVSRPGAQSSLPTRAELEVFLK